MLLQRTGFRPNTLGEESLNLRKPCAGLLLVAYQCNTTASFSSDNGPINKRVIWGLKWPRLLKLSQNCSWGPGHLNPANRRDWRHRPTNTNSASSYEDSNHALTPKNEDTDAEDLNRDLQESRGKEMSASLGIRKLSNAWQSMRNIRSIACEGERGEEDVVNGEPVEWRACECH